MKDLSNVILPRGTEVFFYSPYQIEHKVWKNL